MHCDGARHRWSPAITHLSSASCADDEADEDAATCAYHPSSWAEIERECGLFKEAKEANPNVTLGARRFRKIKKKKYSASALGKWGKWLTRMDELGASPAVLDKGMFPVSLRGLAMWQAISAV